jgi:hypothetical protein
MSANTMASEKLRDRLAKSQDQDGSINSLLGELQTLDAQRDFAQEYELDLPWVSALSVLESSVPGAFQRLAVLGDRFQPAQRSIFHRFIASLWQDDSLGLRPHVVNVDAQKGCEDAMRLHLQSATGQAVDTKAWRRARSTLSCAMLPTTQGKAVATIAASCWDVDRVPTVFRDIAAQWSQMIVAEVDAENGWDVEAMQVKDHAAITAAITAAVGPAPENPDPTWKESEEGKDYQRRAQEAMAAFFSNPPEDYGKRMRAIREVIGLRTSKLVDSALSLTLDGVVHG